MSSIAAWTIRRRLLTAFLSVSVLTAVLGGVGYYAAAAGMAAVEEIGVVRLPSVQSLLIISEAQTAVDSAENALLATNLTAELRKAQYDRFDAARERYQAAWKVYEPLPQTPEEAETWKQFVPAWEKWWKDHEAYVVMAREYEKAPTDEGYNRMSHQALVVIGQSFGDAEALLNKIVTINEDVAKATTAASLASARTAEIVTIVAVILAVGLAIALGLLVTQSLNRVLTLRVAELKEGADQVSAASSQVSAASQALSQGATEQAASLEETSASMEVMAAMTRRNAEGAGEMARLMTEVDGQVQASGRDLESMVAAMEAIKESSAKVSKIIKTIDEIAFQTNILALNAAVEAARAGEAGMGFAVVADEVRNLAQRAAAASKDTAVLIEEAGTNANLGAQRVVKVRESIQGFAGNVGTVRSIAEEVSSSSRQQAQGIDQVTQAITQMEKVTQTTAASAEENAASSEELNAQAETSMGVVYELQALVRGAQTVASGFKAAKPAKAPRAAAAATPAGKAARVLSMKRSTPSADEPAADGTFGAF